MVFDKQMTVFSHSLEDCLSATDCGSYWQHHERPVALGAFVQVRHGTTVSPFFNNPLLKSITVLKQKNLYNVDRASAMSQSISYTLEVILIFIYLAISGVYKETWTGERP